MSQHGSPARAKSPSRSPTLGVRKTQKTKKASNHPQYKEMIRNALVNLKEKNGSSLQKILGYILANFDMSDASQAQVNSRLKFALRSGVKHGLLLRNAEGVGVTGKFRIPRGGPLERKKRRSAAKGKRRRSRKRRSVRKTKRTRKTRRRRSPVRRRRKRRTVRRRRRTARKARATRRRRKARTPRRRRRRVIRKRRQRRARR